MRVGRRLALPVPGLASAFGLRHPATRQLSAADAADVDRVTAYLNSIPRFEAHFVQFGSFGPDAGLILLDRPAAHLRIDYADPAGRVMVIANGKMIILDRGNGSTTTIPVSRTPLGMLLTPSISLSGDITVAAVDRPPGAIQLTLIKTQHPAQGSLTLTLAEKPLRLASVTGQRCRAANFDDEPVWHRHSAEGHT